MLQQFLESLTHPLPSGTSWRARMDREYWIEIDGTIISLYRRDGPEVPLPAKSRLIDADRSARPAPLVEFDWAQLIEVRLLARRSPLPPLFWCFVTHGNHHLIPCGGLYTSALEESFITKLPGCQNQQLIPLEPPIGFESASSWWRRDDRFPKQQGSGCMEPAVSKGQ